MNKVKKFFFNKVGKNKLTSFSDLITSFILGGLKIFILFLFNAISTSLFFGIDENFASIFSLVLTLLILVYVLINRVPNQFNVIKNYLVTIKHKTSGVSEIMIKNKTADSENLNFDTFKEQIYFKNGKKDVHYTFEQLKIKGNLYTTDLIWFEGLKNWTKVSVINELSSIALSKPPLTEKEKNISSFKKSFKPSIIIYIVFSLILGLSAGFLEKYQYDKFFEEVNKNSIQHQKEEDELASKNRREYPEYQNNSTENKLSFTGYSNMHQDEIYATNEDGTRFTRWSSYLAVRGTDQEQISYNESYNFLFRPYKAIIKHANLSREERENIGLLLYNFILSALVTNLIIFPLLIIVYFLKNKKEYGLE